MAKEDINQDNTEDSNSENAVSPESNKHHDAKHNNAKHHAAKHHEAKHHEHQEESAKKVPVEKVVLYSVIGILVIVVCVLAVLLLMGKNDSVAPSTNSTSITSATGLNIVVLNDARCKECDISSLVPQLEQALGTKLNVKNLDYSSAEGKKLYADAKLVSLPAVLFSADVKTSTGIAQVERYLEPKGTYLSLKIGASFDPTKEICDNNVDDDGNGAVDCADSYCSETSVCRPEIKNDLKVFIMSDCPYGKEAIKALKPVVANFGDSITYSVHYIASEDGNGYFNSLHGKYEADENIIQLCTAKYSPTKSLDYLYCRSVAGIKGIDWKTCAASTGVDTAKVQACFDGAEGKQLLRDDIKIADALGVSGSPTWLANNRYTFGGFDAAQVQGNFCQYNVGLAGCANTVVSDSTGPSGSCG